MKDKEYYLHNIAAKFIMGESIDLELEGKTAEIDVLFDLLTTSKNLREALHKNKNMNDISSLLEEKKILTKKFEELTNITWRL